MRPSEYSLNDPVAAIATALVPAALGIVRTSGKGCIELMATLFSRPQALLSAPGGTLVHGWLLEAPDASVTNDGSPTEKRRIDEVMLAVYRSPKSFTGEDAVEVIGHGGPAVVLAVYRLLVSAGFRPAERGEFSFRSFANGHTDLARSEAIREIIGAETDAARDKAAGRLAGNLSTEITAIKNLVMRALAAIEVEIEYPEDEETTKGAFDARAIRDAAEKLKALESGWAAEKLYQDGARVVLAGKTNAGKSSLFNTLLKEDRAIVSDIHGTTRDWLESAADFDGIPVRIYDTAGLRMTSDTIEAEGVERSRTLASAADLVLYLVDGTAGLTADDAAFLGIADDAGGEKRMPAKRMTETPVILVWNKADRDEALPAPEKTQVQAVDAVCAVSAKKGLGIAGLVHAASEILLGERSPGVSSAQGTSSAQGASSAQGTSSTSATSGANRASGEGRTVALGTERQKNAVRASVSFLEHALEAATEGFPMDAIAQDLEDALTPLGEITGEITSADILDTVFSGFCVGK